MKSSLQYWDSSYRQGARRKLSDEIGLWNGRVMRREQVISSADSIEQKDIGQSVAGSAKQAGFHLLLSLNASICHKKPLSPCEYPVQVLNNCQES